MFCESRFDLICTREVADGAVREERDSPEEWLDSHCVNQSKDSQFVSRKAFDAGGIQLSQHSAEQTEKCKEGITSGFSLILCRLR